MKKIRWRYNISIGYDLELELYNGKKVRYFTQLHSEIDDPVS